MALGLQSPALIAPGFGVERGSKNMNPNRAHADDRRSKNAQSDKGWVIRVERGPSRGAMFQVKQKPSVIGRSVDADIAILDLSVSREHASLGLDHDAPIVSDLDSRNGTLVNSVKIHAPTPLKNGDRIQLGDTVFRVAKRSDVEDEHLHRSGEETLSLDVHVPVYESPSRTFAENFSHSGSISAARSMTLTHVMLSDPAKYRRMKWVTVGAAVAIMTIAILLGFVGR